MSKVSARCSQHYLQCLSILAAIAVIWLSVVPPILGFWPQGVALAKRPSEAGSINTRSIGASKAPKLPPRVKTVGVSEIGARSAVLLGRVNAHNQRTVVRFQYGMTKSYGHVAPGPVEETVGGSRFQEFEETVLCLRPKTTYHFRITAKNGSGFVVGRDRTFTTHGTNEGYAELCRNA